jgi:hypothetical protein
MEIEERLEKCEQCSNELKARVEQKSLPRRIYDRIRKIMDNRSNTYFLWLWSIMFYTSLLITLIFDLSGVYAYTIIGIILVFTDVSLTYRTYRLVCEKHPNADPKRFQSIEVNPLARFMVGRFGIIAGGLAYLAFTTALVIYLLNVYNEMTVGAAIGIYMIVIFIHISNIIHFGKLKIQPEPHIANCCKMAQGLED